MQKSSAPSPRLRRTLWAGLLVLVLGLALFWWLRVDLRTSLARSDGAWVRTETYSSIREPEITTAELVLEDPAYRALVDLFAAQSYRKVLLPQNPSHDLTGGANVTFLTLDFTAGGVRTFSLTLTSDGTLQAGGVVLDTWPGQPDVQALFEQAMAILQS